MVKGLNTDQTLMWTMFQNLRNDAASFLPTDAEPSNFGQELLTGLLNNQTFRDTITSVATMIQREDITTEINNTTIGKSPRDGMANGLVSAAGRGDQDVLVDLIKTPDVSILSLEQLEKFWNTDASISSESPHIHTHIQADSKYVAFFDQYAAAKGMKGETITALREKVVAAHETASATLDKIPFDGIQMANYNAASGFYDAIRSGNLNVLGYKELPQKSIFNGLGVTAPITAAELTEVTAPLPHIAIQERKDELAASKPTIVAPPVEPEKVTPNSAPISQEQIIAGLEVIDSPALPPATKTPIETVIPEKSTDPVEPDAKPVIDSTRKMYLSGAFVSSAAASELPNGEVVTAEAEAEAEAGAKVVNESIATLSPEIRRHFSAVTPAQVAAINAEPKIDAKPKGREDYTVKSGDNLWKIAKNEYGLKSYKDIMRTVDHIAQANGLEKGTDANWIQSGQSIKMPTAEQITKPANSINWKTLDEDPKIAHNVLAPA